MYQSKITISHLFLLLVTSCLFMGWTSHPVYVSVTEIEYNDKENSLQISCRLFTGDFEARLRKESKDKINLLAPSDRKKMEAQVSSYILRHLMIIADGKILSPSFLGYEQNEDAIESYFEVNGLKVPTTMEIKDNLLYEDHAQQMSIIHVMVKGIRKSTRLVNPDQDYKFTF